MPESILERATKWRDNGGTGASAKTIYAFFMGETGFSPSYPHDAGDFGRCMGLLRAVPEFEERLGEMSELPGLHGAAWGALAENWPALKESYAAGDEKAFYDLIQGILQPIERKSGEVADVTKALGGGKGGISRITMSVGKKIDLPPRVAADMAAKEPPRPKMPPVPGMAPAQDPAPADGENLLERALELVVRENKVSTSFIQRHLQLGYNRAARIVEELEKAGLVTAADHVGKREITDKARKCVQLVDGVMKVAGETGLPPETVLAEAERRAGVALGDKVDDIAAKHGVSQEVADKVKKDYGIGHNSHQDADVGGISGKRLRAFLERIERMEEEKKAAADDIKDIYAEAKGVGFDTKTLRKLTRLRKMDKEKRREEEELLELYKAAVGLD